MTLTIHKPIIQYRDPDSFRERRHYILVADIGENSILLSHVNLYLAEVTSASIETSKRYSDVIAHFYKFIYKQPKFKKYGTHQYHIIADNRDIRRWQVFRQIERQKAQKVRPSSETIYNDAKQLLLFFGWLRENGYPTNVRVKYKTWQANFKSERLLNYISQKSKMVIDSSNITVLDKKNRQKKLKSLISSLEIDLLLNSFSDPVYCVMFKLAVATAMRPMDLCKFPYVGVGENSHIMPYSEMGSPTGIIDFYVYSSKGNKDREIQINTTALKMLEDEYIIPHYQHRRALYKKRYGKNCPPSILFLNKVGEPITSKMISDRTYYAVGIAHRTNPQFRLGIDFYQARHWWPTMFLLRLYEEEILTTRVDALHAAAGQVLINQMGHADISTTFKYYVNRAQIIARAYHGRVSEVLKESDDIIDFIKQTDKDSIGDQE